MLTCGNVVELHRNGITVTPDKDIRELHCSDNSYLTQGWQKSRKQCIGGIGGHVASSLSNVRLQTITLRILQNKVNLLCRTLT